MTFSYFNYEQDTMLACPCCRVRGMDPLFMQELDALRGHVGFPLRVNSGYRCAKRNAEVSSTGTSGPHTTGMAIDLGVSGREAHALVAAAIERGFTGVGLQQKGPHAGRYVHLDRLLNQPGQPRPWIWTY